MFFSARGAGRSLAGLLIVAFAGAAIAETVYVDSAAKGAATGASWAEAMTDLQAALKTASDSARIFIAAGTYFTGQKGASRQTSFCPRGTMALFGGFPSGGGERDWKKNVTTLSGDINRDDGNAEGAAKRLTDNSFHVVYCEHGTDVRLDGLVFRGGNGIPGESGKKRFEGAGVFIIAWDFQKNARCAISRCRFEGNRCNNGGAGLYMKGRDCLVEECSFVNNRCLSTDGRSDAGNGGGAFFEGYSAVIVASAFEGNAAAMGGGIGFKGKDMSLIRSIFSGNRAGGAGGAALNFEGQACIIDSTRLEKNSAASGQGGGILFRGRTLAMTSCHCRENGAEGNGGVIDFEGDTCWMKTNTFIKNIVGHSGGALRLFCTAANFSQCLFSGNIAQSGEGGAVYFEGKRLSSETSGFSGNIAGKNGGALLMRTQDAFSKNDSFSINSVCRGNGGAVYFEGDAFQCIQGVFRKNHADSGLGGALSLMGKEFMIRGSRCIENSADSAGAIYCYNDVGYGTSMATNGLSIVKSDFIGNASRGAGGALCWLGRGRIEKCRFDGNKAKSGGALFSWNHEVGQKPYFRSVYFPIDSSHRELEIKANKSARISGTVFINNHAGDGAISLGWPGIFNACAFEKNKAEIGKILTGTDEKRSIVACTFTGNIAPGKTTRGEDGL